MTQEKSLVQKESKYPPMEVTVKDNYVDIRFERDNDVWTPLTFRIMPFENRAITINRIEDRKMHDRFLVDIVERSTIMLF